VLETLDAAAVRRWCGGGLESLRAHQDEIDELNVYPVPDGDTGTNLVLTLAAAQEALAGEVLDPAFPSTLSRAMRRMARGALLGARGNSGVIVSQILRGMADSFATSVAVRGGELARALRTATEAAYGAVARPVEGTVLSVVAAAAEGAGRIKSDDLLAVARAAARSASEALARTPQQLPALARAGVVDAGGRGLCLLLDALVEALSAAPAGDREDDSSASRDPVTHIAEPASDGGGAPDHVAEPAADGGGAPDHVVEPASDGGGSDSDMAEPALDGGGSEIHMAEPALGGPQSHVAEPALGGGGSESRVAEPVDDGGHVADHSHVAGAFGYEVQYLLDAEDAAVARLRRSLDRLGDSLVVVGTGDGHPPTWNVHVHVPADRIGPAVEAGVTAGRPHRISVTPLEERIAERRQVARAGPDGPRGAVVVAAGDGLTALFATEGAVVVDRNPSTGEMLAAITAADSRSVVLLPNDANTHAVATAAAREAERAGIRVSVVPTRSPVQALAALAVRDAGRPFADDVIAMAEAAGACRYGEVCTAQRAALTVAGPCREGDLLGLVDGEVHVIGADLEDVSRRLLDRLLGGGGELATLVLGADAPATLDERLREHVTQNWPFVEVQSYAGGQPRYHLLVGVE
jgi:dihydroxyacetone kinase-like predicted kinase